MLAKYNVVTSSLAPVALNRGDTAYIELRIFMYITSVADYFKVSAHKRFIDFTQAYDLVMSELLYKNSHRALHAH